MAKIVTSLTLSVLVVTVLSVGCSNPLSKGEDGSNSVFGNDHNPFLDIGPTPTPSPAPQPFTESFNFNSSVNYGTSTGGEVTGGVARLSASDSTISLTDDGTATAADTSFSDYASKDSNISVTGDQVAMTSGSSGQYTSVAIDGRNSLTPWSLVKFKTSFPFFKELPSNNPGVQNESTADYSATETNLMTGILSVWHLNEYSGTTLLDDTGSGNTGNVQGGITLGGLGRFGRAPTFNGSTGYISSTNLSTGPHLFSVQAWFKSSSSTGGYIVGYGSTATGAAPNYDRHIYMSDAGKIVFGVYPGSVKTIVSPLSYNDGNWHHVVGMVSSSGQALYIDGTLVSIVPTVTSAQVYNGYWRIGYNGMSATWTNSPSVKYWNGQIDEVAVWNRQLNTNEVTALYRRGANRLKIQLRTCTAASGNDCSGTVTSWVGPDGTNATFFSENYNSTNPVTLLGKISSGIYQTAWSLFTGGFSSWLISGTNQTNQYIQFKALFESDSASLYPDLKSVTVSPEPRYSTLVMAYNQASSAIRFSSISKVLIASACGDANSNSVADDIRFDFNTDGGANYFYWNGASWIKNISGYSSANTQTIVESLTSTDWALLPTASDKQLHLRVYLVSSGITPCQIDDVAVAGQR